MSSRYLIPVLCVGAVAFACGPRAHNEASTPAKTNAPVAQASEGFVIRQQASPRVRNKDRRTPAPVAAHLYVRRSDSEIRFALHVVNTGKKGVEIRFPSGQTYDFVVLDSVGREIWRWGSDRMFTQALRNKMLRAGDALDFEEALEADSLAPGRYVARGTLTSANYPLTQEAEFTISGTTIASR